eukprot:CAMPEP_0115837236 /NCGR_PEP_ID=MMETSP0287-20121206/5116_1 /TAXON_ID=412157 /ORGANISM="Chrysochromulina rotalis, Strain UIO044" /LENGTH=34 /DNA_ID= /DNA_START= /DNA_END= /DNA_ORIENTATION=
MAHDMRIPYNLSPCEERECPMAPTTTSAWNLDIA